MAQQIEEVYRRPEADIEKLKQNWKKDPCWDLCDTDGFEAHKEDLKAYQDEMEQVWEQEREHKKREQQSKQKTALYDMNLGDSTKINNHHFVRVPGGWVLEKIEEVYSESKSTSRSIAAVFIPFSDEFEPRKPEGQESAQA